MNQAAQAQPVEASPAPPKVANLAANRMFLAGYHFQTYDILIPVGHSPADLSRSDYWTHHAKRLKVFDKLECVEESGAWEICLRVVARGDTWVATRPIWFVERKGDPDLEPMENKFEIVNVPPGRFLVRWKESKRAIAETPFGTKDEAIRARDEFIKTLKNRR